MADVFTKKKRSWIMSRIRSKWTKQEVIVHNYLKGKKIKHKMHPKMIGGPDIVIPDKRIAIFLHGCFWHKCPIHYREPKSGKKFWRTKVENNVLRDKKGIRLIKKNGWKPVIIWEHDIKNKKFAEKLKSCGSIDKGSVQ